MRCTSTSVEMYLLGTNAPGVAYTEYEKYLAEMRVYRFCPLDYETWLSWREYYKQRDGGLMK